MVGPIFNLFILKCSFGPLFFRLDDCLFVWTIIRLFGCRLDDRLFIQAIVCSLFGRCLETMRRVSITLAMFLNNATRFYHFGDVFK